MKKVHPLRAYRYRNSITLNDLAAAVRTTSASLSRIERRRQAPSMRMLNKLTKATGLSADDFLVAEVRR